MIDCESHVQTLREYNSQQEFESYNRIDKRRYITNLMKVCYEKLNVNGCILVFKMKFQLNFFRKSLLF